MDNPFPLEELQRILPAVTLFGTATVILVLDLFLAGWRAAHGFPSGDSSQESTGGRRSARWLLPALSLAGVILATAFLAQDWSRPSIVAFRGTLRIDLFSNAITGLILLGTLLTLLSTGGALRQLRLEHGEFYALLLYAAGAMILLAEANNLIMIFLSLESLSMAVYLLTAYDREQKRSVEGALKYFVLGGLASGFLLLGLAFVYGASGTIRLDDLQGALATNGLGAVDRSLFFTGLALTLVGFGFKIGAFPFHSWIPDVYEGAPSVVTGFMAVAVKAAAMAIVVRFALGVVVSPELSGPVVTSLWWIALATMVFANLVALVQTSVKRMLAYSAISHTGYLLVGLVAAVTPPFDGAIRGAPILFYLLPYTLMTFGAFALLSCLGRNSSAGETFDSFRGLSQRQPVIAFTVMIFMVSLAGIPPTAGFWGKLYLFRAAVQSGQWVLALVGVLASIVSVYYYLRLVVVMYMQPMADDEEDDGAPVVNLGSALAMAAAAAAIIAIGFYPEFLLSQSAESVRTVLLLGR